MNNLYLPKIITNSFKKFPEQIAIDYNERVLTYIELKKLVDKWKLEIEDAEIQPGFRVLLVIDDPIHFISLWIALWLNNCIIIPLEPNISGDELKQAVDASQCEFIVGHSQLDYKNLAQKTLSENFSIIVPQWKYIKLESEIKYALNDTALFFYTSGTTGLPKCVEFTHEAMTENVISLSKKINLCEKDVLFTPLSPMLPATIATAVLPALASGATLVLVKSPLPSKVLRIIEHKRVSVFFAVPYMYELIVSSLNNRNNNAFKNVRLCLTGSAFSEAKLFKQFYNSTKLPIHSIYCSSEAGAITYNDSQDLYSIQYSVGRCLSGVKIKIDYNNHPGKDDGEILVSGTHLAKGYFNRPELQNEIFKNHWVRTGDLGRLNKEGYLYLSGRISDTINVSGYLVNPVEVENVISNIDGVKDALVFSKKDEKMGESIGAKIILNPGYKMKFDDIVNYCSNHLNHYKIPRFIEFVKEFSTSRYGKKVRNEEGN